MTRIGNYDEQIRSGAATGGSRREASLDIQCFQSKGHLSAAIKLCLYQPELSLVEAHAHSEKLEAMLLSRIEELDRVTLHIEPGKS